jgi:VWFA-related protein
VLTPDKNTDLFGAMRAIFERVGGRSGNEVVLLFSDGKDSVDRDFAKQRPVKDSKQVIREAQGSRTQIYAACFKPEGENSRSPFPIGGLGGAGYGSDCKFLSEIADGAGGRSFEFESQSALAQVLKKTLDELRSQYTLAYYSSSQGNRAGFHKIKVVVKKPDLIARTREGYLVSK